MEFTVFQTQLKINVTYTHDIVVSSHEHTLNTLYALECNTSPNSKPKERKNDLQNCLSPTRIQ